MSASKYFETIKELINNIEETQMDKIQTAAKVFTETIKNDKIIHVFGTGHSNMLGIELFVRAGGLAPVNAMLDDTVMVNFGARKGGKLEQLSGLASIIWEQYDIKKGDIMLIASNSGRNAVPVEMALLAKEKGIFTIALTSLNHSKNCASRHSSGKKLFEIADLVIDNLVPYGDVLLDYNGIKSGPATTIAGVFIVNSIVAETLAILSKEGFNLPIYTSQNVDGYNNDYLYEKYQSRIKHI